MARKDSLLRLHKRLVAKRDALRKKLGENFDPDRPARSTDGDLGDVANEGAQKEIASQIADLESRELNQVERAIDLIRHGKYGNCEVCNNKIPIARLQALPFTVFCVNCQRQLEETGEIDGQGEHDWESAYEFEGRLSDRELTISDLDVEL